MKNIQLLDCTLRDGGHVNNAEFGEANIRKIITALFKTNTDIVELGFLKNGSFTKDQSSYSTVEQARTNLVDIEERPVHCSLMIRPDWYDISQLTDADGLIDTIRFAFYYKDFDLTERYFHYAMDRGYKCILNPVNVMGYDSEQLITLLNRINQLHPFGTTMVDTFGSMQFHDLERLYSAFENHLDPDITIGLHLHENMASSFQLAQHYLAIKKGDRRAIIDASLLGMGRIPGNLCIEMMLDFLHDYDKKYNVGPALKVIDECIIPIKRKREWGYFPAYYFSGKFRIHRSYAEYFLEKDLDLEDVYLILLHLEDDPQKSFFSATKAEELYLKYMEEKNGKN